MNRGCAGFFLQLPLQIKYIFLYSMPRNLLQTLFHTARCIQKTIIDLFMRKLLCVEFPQGQ